MVFTCVFCEKEWCYTTYLCEGCRSLKHTKLLYGDKFNEVIKNVLLRNDQGITNKEKQELSKEKDVVESAMELRNKKLKKNLE